MEPASGYTSGAFGLRVSSRRGTGSSGDPGFAGNANTATDDGASIVSGFTGGVIGVLGTHEDITESKRAAEELRESQEGFRSVVENAPESIFVSTGGCFRYLNPPAIRLLGAASASELLGRPLIESVHPDSRAAESGDAGIREIVSCYLSDKRTFAARLERLGGY